MINKKDQLLNKSDVMFHDTETKMAETSDRQQRAL